MKGIAAFGGLALGVVNLALFLYKEFFRKATLSASISFAEVRSVTADTFDIQVDVHLRAKGGTVYLNRLHFDNKTPVFDPVQGVGIRDVYKVINKLGYDILASANGEGFIDRLQTLFPESFYIANTKMEDKEHRVITIIDRIVIGRHMDGPWEWPLHNWTLEFESSARNVKVGFDFKKHKTNIYNNFCH
ncbi:hypothetical protein L5M28_14860 [Shewanella sp. SW32]|nr:MULTISPECIES: hypothetical protein [unclassified Shewanella]MCU7963847.1 hypothetical protein [Shewanella sp. SW32]MCU7971673.1 hypothetical protein [Shewanella sp. SW29]